MMIQSIPLVEVQLGQPLQVESSVQYLHMSQAIVISIPAIEIQKIPYTTSQEAEKGEGEIGNIYLFAQKDCIHSSKLKEHLYENWMVYITI